MEKEIIGLATDTQIKEWKEKHISLYHIKVGDHIAYFRNPEIADMNIAMSQTTPDSQLAYFQAIFRETKIGGSDAIANEPKLLMGFVEKVKEKLEGEKAELVNY